jgi:ribosomal protein S18 acetylase RimI-like enzyme
VVSEWGPACRLIFQHLPPEDREQREAQALQLLERGELRPAGLFVVSAVGQLQGALLCAAISGAAGLLWLPGLASTGADGVGDALACHAVAWLRQQGVKLIQCLLRSDEEPLAAPLLKAGLARITDLWYLQHDQTATVASLGLTARLTFANFEEAPRALFEEVLTRTYEGTQDCPEINGVRTLDEVINGHMAQGAFDPARWWLALDDGRPVAILLMTELPESGDWDVSYMGVVPEVRRRGYGQEVLLKGLTEAWAAGVRRVVLCVDSRNRPAWDLYRRMGFEAYDRRAVYLAISGRPAV